MKNVVRPCILVMCLFAFTTLSAQIQSDLQAAAYEQMAAEHHLDSAELQRFVHATHNHVGADTAFRFHPDANGAPLFVTNPGFETGDFTGWTGFTGENYYSATAPLGDILPGFQSTVMNPSPTDPMARHNIMTVAGGNDSMGGFPVVPPSYGNYTMRLGSLGNSYDAQIIEQTWLVSPADSVLCISYAVVIEDGGHPGIESSYFKYELVDSGGNVIFMRQDLSSVLPATYLPSTNQTFYLPWQTDTFDLTAHIGVPVTLRFITAGCIWSGHNTYCYIDVEPGQTSTGVSNVDRYAAIQVYPNPSATGIYSVICDPSSSEEIPVVYDMSGRVVNAAITRNVNGWTVDLSKAAPGMYSLSVPTGNGVSHCNLVR